MTLYPAATKFHKYAIRPGEKPAWPSATTIAKLASDMGGLPWGAAKETALFAVHHQDEWQSLPVEDAVDKLRRHFQGVWDAKRDRGSVVHDLALGWAQGKDVDVPVDCEPYMDALERFWTDWEPQFVMCERAVVHDVPGFEYGGRFDAIAILNYDETWQLDWKTGSRFPVETTLQMAAYRYATGLAVTDAEGLLVSVEPMPPIDKSGVVYLHDDGTYELLELPLTPETHDVLLKLRKVWEWNRDMASWLKKKHPEPARVSA